MSKLGDKKMLKTAHKHTQKLLKRIGRANKSGRTALVQELIKTDMNSRSAKYVAIKDAMKELPNHHKSGDMDVDKIASRLNPYAGSDEPATLHYKTKKSDDDFRPIMDFGIENRALQYLVLRPLEVLADLHPSQFGTRGGVNTAIQEVISNQSDGYTYVAEVDINDFFKSVGAKVLSDHLPIPKKVTDHVVSSQHLTIIPGNIKQYLGDPNGGADILTDVSDPLYQAIEEGRQGIAQGSATSSLVAEIILAPTLSSLPECGRVVAYIDNILVMGKSASDVELMISNLRLALLEHPVGPFASQVLSRAIPGEKFDFLGYELFRKGALYKARPSGGNVSKFSRKFDSALSELEDKELSPVIRKSKAKSLARYVRHWTSAFKSWDKAEKFRTSRLALIHIAISEAL